LNKQSITLLNSANMFFNFQPCFNILLCNH
jgi:hypothetical protein